MFLCIWKIKFILEKSLNHEPFNLLYETHNWNSEPQNIEQEITNDEVWNRCAQSFFNNERIPYFDIRHFLFGIRYLSASGGFAFSEFPFRSDRQFFWSAAELNPEPLYFFP